MTRAFFRLTPLCVALACGPTILLPEDETDSSGTTSEGPVVTTALPPATSTPPSTSTSTSTSTSMSTSTGDDSVDESTGVLFLIIPDGGGCAISDDGHWHCFECTLFAQDCPPGEKCMPWANDGGEVWNASRCSPIDDSPGQPGDECTVEGSGVSGIDSCDLGVMCWDVDPKSNVGTCVAMCTGDEANPLCRSDQTRCMIANDGYLVLCLPVCDPLVPDLCPAGQGCIAVDEDPVCLPTAGVESFSACGPDGCGPDGACLDSDELEACMDFGCCTPWCDLNAADPDLPCAAEPAHSCQPFYAPGEAPAGLEHLGVCRLPA